MKPLVVAVVALALHLALGWAFTILAGVLAGYWVVRRGWLVGALGVGLEWMGLLLYNYVVAAREVGVMTNVMGEIMGNLPGGVIVGLTLLIGVLLGALGGAVGTQFALWLRRERIDTVP